MQEVGTRVEQGLHVAEVLAAAAFDHVAGERERAAAEADERNAAAQRLAHHGEGVEHVAQPRRVGNGERGDVALGAQRPLELRPLAFDEVQPQSHRVGHREDVGEDDRSVEREALDRLQRDLTGELGRLREREEAAGLAPRGVVFGKVAPRLAHDPDRRVRRRFAQQRAQERVVAHARFYRLRSRKARIAAS